MLVPALDCCTKQTLCVFFWWEMQSPKQYVHMIEQSDCNVRTIASLFVYRCVHGATAIV